MDAYVHVLDQLRKDDYKRLRSYAADPGSKFTTWLVVVTRRACVDFHRIRYGRARVDDTLRSRDRRSLRRKLQDLAPTSEDLSLVVDDAAPGADAQLLDEELTTGLQSALDALTPKDRLLLALRFEEDLSASEIAKILLLPSPFHVYRRLNVVLASMRSILKSRGIETAVP